MVVPDGVVQGQRLVALAPCVAGPRIAVDDDGRHVELAQPRAKGDATLPAAHDDHVWLSDMAELLRFAPALLEPGLPVPYGAVLGSNRSPVMLRLFEAFEILQRRQQRLGFAIPEPEMTYAPAGRGLELDPALVWPACLAQLVRDRKTAGPYKLECL